MNYIHKQTGLIAVPIDGCDTYCVAWGDLTKSYISKIFIENTQDWSPVKELLFKTEDGVDIYENQLYFKLHPDWIISIKIASSDHNSSMIIFNGKRFSTKETAEEYKKLHQPKYTQTQLFDFFKLGAEIADTHGTSHLKNEFDKLLKSIS